MENLTKISVSVLTKVCNKNHRKVYVNSLRGREELTAECPPDIVAEVLAVWGSAPTMPDAPETHPAPPMPPAPPPDPRDLAITQLMREVAALKAKEAETIG